MTLVNKTFSQLITFTRASSATFVGSNGLIQSATTNTPRFDYDPVTLAAKGLLIEEQRTNLLTYSEDFSAGPWSKANLTITPNATTSPSGATNAQQVTATATAATSLIQDQVVNATSATFTVYVKTGSGATDMNVFIVRNVTTSTNLLGGSLNYTTGVWTYAIGSSGVSVSNAGNGWWRLEMVMTSGITSGNTLRPYVGSTGVSLNAGVFAYFWGAQLEAGSFATSYIPTVASQVTRSADVALVNTLSPWYNATEGTFFADFAGMNSPSGIYGRAIGYDGARAFISGDGAVNRVASWNNAVNLVASFSGNVLTGAKAALAYSGAGRSLVGNGGTVATDANLIGSVTTVRLGSSATTNEYLNGHIRRITYYKRRLSNADLQSITL